MARITVSGGAGERVVRKAADETVTNSTTLQDDDHLLFTVGANETWAFEFTIFAEATSAADVKTALTVPAGAALIAGQIAEQFTSAATTPSTSLTSGAAFLNGGTSGGVGVPTCIVIRGSVANGATAGNVTLQWAQNAASATPAKVYAGSYVVCRRVV